MTASTVEVAGVTIRYRELGDPDAPTVVLLHGGSSSAATWDRLCIALAAAGRRTIAADLRGHGGSSRTHAYPLAGFRDDIVGLLDALALDRVALVGHSLGAHTASLIAQQQPGRISHLVLEEPPVPAYEASGSHSFATPRFLLPALSQLDAVGLRRPTQPHTFATVSGDVPRDSARPAGHYPGWTPRPQPRNTRVPRRRRPVPDRQQLNRGEPVQIAILLFERFTALDAVGPYDVLSHLPGAEVVFVANQAGPVVNEVGSLRLVADASLADVPRPDVIVVPGGPGQNAHMHDGPLRRWLRAADGYTTWTASVCTGSLLLAAAGLLTGRRATTHWLRHDDLAPLGAVAVNARVVFDGKYVTAAGVSAGLDMAFALAGRIGGDAAAQAIQLGHEYDPQPPYQAGSPAKAPRAITEALLARRESIIN
jgi:putative intracellular protease/amidase